jgi:T5SS/PEP-CTERM-associated repeat protein/autotransporter-associated beta strand protein
MAQLNYTPETGDVVSGGDQLLRDATSEGAITERNYAAVIDHTDKLVRRFFFKEVVVVSIRKGCASLILIILARSSLSAQEISHWTLDNSTSDAVGNRDGTLLGNAMYSTNVPSSLVGYSTHSLSLDGSLDKMIYDVQAGDSLTGSFTVALWFNPMERRTDGTLGFFGTRSPNQFGFDAKIMPNNGVRIDVGNGSDFDSRILTQYGFNVQLSEWHHIAFAVTGNKADIYLDGTPFATWTYSSMTPILFDANHDIGIGAVGAYADSHGEDFHGLIDDVRIFGRSLTATEVQQVMTPGSIWSRSSGGSWTSAANWNPGNVPNGSQARAVFANAIAAPSTITVDADIIASQIVFDNSTNSYTIAGDGAHSLRLANNALINVATGSHTIAAPVKVNLGGTLTKVGAGTLVLSGSIRDAGTMDISGGLLRIIGGATVANINGVIGNALGSSGTVIVEGAESAWTNSSISVGELGDGVLTIRDSGNASSSDDLTVGYLGSGRVNISEGATLSSQVAGIGFLPGSSGIMVVDGDGTIWNNVTSFWAGYSGSGELRVTGKADVSTGAARIGENGGSMGSVTVEGAGSTWTNSSYVDIGIQGLGALNIINGGVVSNTSGLVGLAPGSAGNVNVSGKDSKWNNSSSLTVGNSGSGTLTIMGEGAVTNTSATIAIDNGSTGTVTVDGKGSSWTMSGPLGIGGSAVNNQPGGTGTLNIRSGGTVNVGGSTVIFANGSLNLVGGTFRTSALNNRGVVELGGTLTSTGHATITGAGVLKGSGTIEGNVTNSGRVAPGFSPGIMEIDGNYTQPSNGVLEIEVGGLTAEPPNPLHDKLIVTGTAMLGGRLEVPFIQVPGQPPYIPQANDPPIIFLTAGKDPEVVELSGTFDSVLFRDLPTGVAHELDYVNDQVRLRFVTPAPIEFVSADPVAVWSNSATWLMNGMPTVPTSKNIISIENQTSGDQRVVLASRNESVHELSVGETSAITLRVDAANLSVSTETLIGAQGVLELGNEMGRDGILTSESVMVQDGGELRGNGTVVGNVSVGTVGDQPAIFSPGFSVGKTDVIGNYQQGPNGVVELDVETTTELFDKIGVSANVELAGTLRIDASQLTDFTPGEPMEIITAGNLSGKFDLIETVGNDDLRFFVEYTATSAWAEGWIPGDLNGDENPAEDVDFDLFVFALMNRDDYTFMQMVESTCPEREPGVPGTCRPGKASNTGSFPVNGVDDHKVNFDDIAEFQNILARKGMSSARLMAAFARYYGQVPEPPCALLITIGSLLTGCVSARRRKCQFS